MAAANLIVSEKTGVWTAVLRREIGAAELRIHETRSLAECWEELRHAPASFVVCEATGTNAAAVCEFLTRLGQRCSDARAVVAVQSDASEFVDLFGEAGAIHVVTNTRDLRTVAVLARRHFQKFPTLDDSLRSQVWRRLPWSNQRPADAAAPASRGPLSK